MATTTNVVTTVTADDIEYIDDPLARDGKPLTDGCSLINQSVVHQHIGRQITSIQARVGGAKCMLVAVTTKCIRSVIERDQISKQKQWNQQIADLKASGKEQEDSEIKVLQCRIQQNLNRNYNAKVVITRTSHKFQCKDRFVEIAVKESTESVSAFTNKEFINVLYHHYFTLDRHQTFESIIRRYALKWIESLEKGRGRNIETNDALRLIRIRCHEEEYRDIIQSNERIIDQKYISDQDGGCVYDKCHRIVRDSYGMLC